MANLRCNVIHCEYNDNNHCCRNDIQVSGGREAKSSQETCCESFRERNTQSVNQSSCCNCHYPKKTLQIACNAVSCRFNACGICKANTVDIGGYAAHKRSDTECNTFVRGACPPCR